MEYIQNPPTAVPPLLQGLSQEEASVVFELVGILKRRRSQKPRTASRSTQDEDLDARYWVLSEIIQDFIALHRRNDPALRKMLGAWIASRQPQTPTGSLIGVDSDDASKREGRVKRLIAFLHMEESFDDPQ
jgi:hypothetical protein